MDGIFVLFLNGKVKAFSEYEETIRTIYAERKDYFDIKYIKGKIADEIREKHPDLQVVEDASMTIEEWEYFILSLQQLPIDIICAIDKAQDIIYCLKKEYRKPIMDLLLFLAERANENQYDCIQDEEDKWNMESCRKYFFK